VLPAAKKLAVIEFEDEAAVNFKLLAIALRGVVMNTGEAAVVTNSHGLQHHLEGPSCATPIPAELGTGRITALVVAGDGASPRRMPGGVLVEKVGERLEVALIEGLVTASHGFGVFFCSVNGVALLCCGW